MEIASLTGSLAPLAVLACPVGMGLMMWMMARGGTRERKSGPDKHEASRQPASIEVLREEQRRLSEEIDRLESRQGTEAEVSEQR